MKKIINNYLPLIATLLILGWAIFLRLYRVTSVPPSPYWEEVALGYDAYALLKTGADHHGNSWPIVAVESFGDWKPSGYFYLLIPFIKIFGLNLLSVRLPSIISGVFIVLGVGRLLAEYLQLTSTKQRVKTWLPIVGMFITSISPWAIQFSRAGWEVNAATCLVLWGMIACINFIENQQKKNGWRFILGAILLILAMYTYHATRMIVPFLGLGLVYLWVIKTHRNRESIVATLRNWLKQFHQTLLITTITTLILLLPLGLSLGKKEISQRFAETSIFTNIEVIKESNLRKEREHNSVISRLLYHRYVLFGREIAINYLKHFDINFLFISGDKNPRHSIQYLGHFYHIEVLLLLLGLYWLIKNWRFESGLFIFWLVMGILPAAITNASPHALRILPTLPVWIMLLTLGVFQLGELVVKIGHDLLRIKIKYGWLIFSFALAGVYFLEFTMFWRTYLKIYPQVYAQEWQYGYQSLITQFENFKTQYPHLTNQYITREYGRPAMYYFFYNQTDPSDVQQVAQISAQDQGELLEYHQLKFINNVNQGLNTPALVASSLQQYLDYKQNFPDRQVSILDEVDDLQSQPIWIIFKVE